MRGWLASLIAFSFMLQGAGGEALAASPHPGPIAAVTLTEDGLIMDWRAAWPHVELLADGTVHVTMEGYSSSAQPGQPQLPFTSALIALPPDAAPTLQVLRAEESALALPGPLALSAHPAGVELDVDGQPIGGAFVPSSPSASAWTAREDAGQEHLVEVVTMQEMGVVRGVRLARLAFYPIYGAEPNWRLTPHLRVAVNFNTTLSSSIPPNIADPVLASVLGMVVNPTQVRTVPSPPALRPPISGGEGGRGDEGGSIPITAAIVVTTTGLTALTYEALAEIGFPVTMTNPANLHLTRAGSQIAAQWEGDADEVFEPGERLLFYAEPRFSRWAANDVYFLTVGSTPGQRMASRSAAPSGLPLGSAGVQQLVETNALYTPQCYCGSIPAGRDGDHWTWDALHWPDRTALSFPFLLPTVNASQPATLTVWLIGYTDVLAAPDHRVEVGLNGATLGHAEWEGKQAITATLAITPGLLTDGVNTLTLTLPGLPDIFVEGAWLDAFSIQYARGSAASGSAALFTGEAAPRAYTLALASSTDVRAYDVTAPDQPILLTEIAVSGTLISLGDPLDGGPHRYMIAASDGVLAPAGMRLAGAASGVTDADYIIISAPDFIPALSSLIALREEQGLGVIVEDVQAIYDTYGDGRPDPEAIRAYLSEAYTTWPTPPVYVLLVGDGTFDPKRYRAASSATFIPPYLADVDPWIGETASDNRYVTVDGDDALPDMLIGRLPVNSLEEAQTVIDKIVRYETVPYPGGWNANVVFAADDADTSGNFPADSDDLAATFVSAPYVARPVYFTPPTTTITVARQSLLQNWNAGASLLVYTGHSSIHQWSAERLFHNDDIAALTNNQRLPVVLELTCFTSTFQDPASATLDEALLRHPTGGAVAVWGATGLGVATGHHDLAHGFMQSLYLGQPAGLGAAALEGKLAVAASGQNLDLLDTYVLLGDPAMALDLNLVPWSHSISLPIVSH